MGVESTNKEQPCSEAQNFIPSSGMAGPVKGKGLCVYLERFPLHRVEKQTGSREVAKGLQVLAVILNSVQATSVSLLMSQRDSFS